MAYAEDARLILSQAEMVAFLSHVDHPTEEEIAARDRLFKELDTLNLKALPDRSYEFEM